MNYTVASALGIFIACSFSAGAATTYSSAFEEPTFDQFGDVAGNDGWIIDTPVVGISFLNPYDVDGPGGSPSSQAGALGGSVDTPGPAGTEVNLTHAISIDLASLSFSVDFAVLGSTAGFPGVDEFGFTISEGANELIRIAFEDTATSGSSLEIVWYDNLGTRNVLAPSSAIQYGSANSLSLDFTPASAGADAAFTAAIASLNTVNFAGTLVGAGAAVADGIGVDFDVAGDGDNFIVFDNFAVVPEPSSSILAVLGMALFLRRRR